MGRVVGMIGLTPEELAHFNLTTEGEILLQAKNHCPGPLPANLRAKDALKCSWVVRSKKCLNLTQDEPVFIGRGCSGQSCHIENSYAETLCLLESYGIDVNVHNESRRETCGLDPVDSAWLIPDSEHAKKPVIGSSDCQDIFVKGVKYYNKVECVDDRPELHSTLVFPEDWDMGKNPYTCYINPTCSHHRFKSMTVCQSSVAQFASGERPLPTAGIDPSMPGQESVLAGSNSLCAMPGRLVALLFTTALILHHDFFR